MQREGSCCGLDREYALSNIYSRALKGQFRVSVDVAYLRACISSAELLKDAISLKKICDIYSLSLFTLV